MIQKVKPGFDVSKKDQTLPIYNRAQHAPWKLICLRHWLLSTSTVKLGMNFLRALCSLHPLYTAKFTQSASKSIKSDHLHRWWGVAERSNLYQGLVALSQVLASRPLKSQPLTISLPSNQSFTEVSGIKELLRQWEDATMEVCQVYVLNTFDLRGCMIALPLIWKFFEVITRSMWSFQGLSKQELIIWGLSNTPKLSPIDEGHHQTDSPEVGKRTPSDLIKTGCRVKTPSYSRKSVHKSVSKYASKWCCGSGGKCRQTDSIRSNGDGLPCQDSIVLTTSLFTRDSIEYISKRTVLELGSVLKCLFVLMSSLDILTIF